ncbi:sulfotransferase domain-containing protein [Thermodesulfobacteriota bacterium]
MLKKIKSIRKSKAKSIFYVTLPKSGTDFTHNTLVNITNLKMPEIINSKTINEMQTGYYEISKKLPFVGDFDTQIMNVKGTKQYHNRGYVFGTHMAASYYNIQVLSKAGVSRITLLVRDPRDVVVSWSYHLKKYGPAIRNYNSLFQYLPKDYFSWTHEQQLHFQIRTFLPKAINWIESWIGVYEENYTYLKIQIVFFDHLRSDTRDFFEKILCFHKIADYDLTKIESPKSRPHYRKGTHDQWKNEFSDHDKLFVSSLIEDRLKKAFLRAASSHRSFEKGQKAMRDGVPQKAAYEFFKVLKQFPHNHLTFQLMESALAANNTPITDELKAETKAFLEKEKNLFRMPNDLLNRVHRYLKSTIKPI